MRTIAAVMFVLALPTMAQARFRSEPVPDTGYHPPRIEGRTTSGGAQASRELDRARSDIKRRRDSGELTRGEARQLRREARRIEAMSQRYGRDGLSEFERRELEIRVNELRARTATGRAA